jgi:hypothetical protein
VGGIAADAAVGYADDTAVVAAACFDNTVVDTSYVVVRIIAVGTVAVVAVAAAAAFDTR